MVELGGGSLVCLWTPDGGTRRDSLACWWIRTGGTGGDIFFYGDAMMDNGMVGGG